MNVQRRTMVFYWALAAVFVFTFKNSAYQNQCALALGASFLPHNPWDVGGAFPGCEVHFFRPLMSSYLSQSSQGTILES